MEGETGGGERGREGGGFDLNLGTSIDPVVIVVVEGNPQPLLSMPRPPFNRSVNEDFIWVLSLVLFFAQAVRAELYEVKRNGKIPRERERETERAGGRERWIRSEG